MNQLIQPQPRPSILVVEDEHALRDLLVLALEDIDADVQAVACADDGFEVLADRPWTLLLTDVRTPGDRDGLQLAWHARELMPTTRIIVMSGYHDHMDEPLPDGTVFLAKPWSLDTFYATVRGQLVGHPGFRAAA